MTEKETALREQLQQAIQAQESLRGTLPDAVVDATVVALRKQLDELDAAAAPEQQRKQVTVLFADVVGFTAMSESMDAELVTGLMNDVWEALDTVILAHGGRIDKHIGDAVMALWGVDTAREDDPEQAIRAALAMQAAVQAFCETHQTPLSIRIGINTGPTLLGQIGTKGEYTAMGDAVNLASRLEHAAPVGSVLIGHDTYRHVRGIFDVLPQEPLTVKGRTEPAQTYIVQKAKPRAFRLRTRGVEGVETRMIGRDGEFLILQQAFLDATEEGETRLALVVGEAGVGKSRLLYEFDNWLELRPERITYFKGRSTANLQTVPYSLFRDLFAFRFDIRDSDSRAVAIEKFRAGFLSAGNISTLADAELGPAAAGLATDQADIVGHWLGFDFSQSKAVTNLLGSPDFATVARVHLLRYLHHATNAGAVVMLLEDIHWADDSSLDLVAQLLQALPEARLLIVGVARPSLYERRTLWREGERAVSHIDLRPLSRHAGRALVDEILQRVDYVPAVLRETIVDAAEGNPFYTEELIKMFIDQGVIVRGVETEFLPRNSVSKAGADRWRVRTDRLAELKVPPTLTGLLQARLDGLPQLERELLQRAAVVGRLFWDGVVADLAQTEPAEIRPVLQSIRKRELIFQREHSAFAGSDEFAFKHNLLRDVAYERVLLKWRRAFHGRVARWLEAHAGERLSEYFGLIAQHYELAGEDEQAAVYLLRSGKEALEANADDAARRAFERAITLREPVAEEGDPLLVEALVLLGEVALKQADFGPAETALRRGLAAARALDSAGWQAVALNSLTELARLQGAYQDSLNLAVDQALPQARTIGGATLAASLYQIAGSYWQLGDLEAARVYADESLTVAQASDVKSRVAYAVNLLGLLADEQGDFEMAAQYFRQALALARDAGNIRQEVIPLLNLGNTSYLAGDYAAAQHYGLAALQKAREAGHPAGEVIVLGNLSQATLKLGEPTAARGYARETLRLAVQLNTAPGILFAVQASAEILASEGDKTRALELLWLAHDHPAQHIQARVEIQEILAALDAGEAESAAARAAAAELALEAVVAELLAEEGE